MKGWDIDEKFLGMTIFAIVPNISEFSNAINFASYQNIALSLEIGSAYVVQVAMVQIPVLVAYSAWSCRNLLEDNLDYSKIFTFVILYYLRMIFPKWDFITVFFSVFLLSYVYIEGKSNYFKGTVLTLTYIVFAASFYQLPGAIESNFLNNTLGERNVSGKITV